MYRHKILSSNKAQIYLHAFEACDDGVLTAIEKNDGRVDVMTPSSLPEKVSISKISKMGVQSPDKMCNYMRPKVRDTVVAYTYSSTTDNSVDIPLDPSKLAYISIKQDCALLGITDSTKCTAYVLAANTGFRMNSSSPPEIKYQLVKAAPSADYYGFSLKIVRFDLKTETF